MNPLCQKHLKMNHLGSWRWNIHFQHHSSRITEHHQSLRVAPALFWCRNRPPNVCAAPKACESGETRHEDCDTSFLAVLAAGASKKTTSLRILEINLCIQQEVIHLCWSQSISFLRNTSTGDDDPIWLLHIFRRGVEKAPTRNMLPFESWSTSL